VSVWRLGGTVYCGGEAQVRAYVSFGGRAISECERDAAFGWFLDGFELLVELDSR